MAVKERAISAAIPKPVLVLVACVIFAGCHGAASNRPLPQGASRITIPRIDDHAMAVYVYGSHSKHRFFDHPIPKEHRNGLDELSLRPGTHVLEIDCHRPNAVAVMHGGIDFEVTVEANATYVLDCDPKRDPQYGYYENHFSLTRVEPQEEVKQPPLEIGPWLGCYDVTVDRADKHVNLGRLRLTDHLEPATAGTYTVETVKEGERQMTMMGWWPMSTTSIHLSLGDGYTGWGGELERTSVGLKGLAPWSTDTGKKNGGSILHASPVTCDP